MIQDELYDGGKIEYIVEFKIFIIRIKTIFNTFVLFLFNPLLRNWLSHLTK